MLRGIWPGELSSNLWKKGLGFRVYLHENRTKRGRNPTWLDASVRGGANPKP